MGTTFNITAPDGTQYQVQGPDGATEQQALAQVQAQHAPAPTAQSSNGGILKNLGAGAVQAVSGAANTVTNMFNPLHDITAMVNPDLAKKSDAGAYVGHLINSAVPNAINPEKVTQNTFPDKLARGVGAGLTGAVVPGGDGYTVGSMLANAAMGGVSGAGAVTGGEIANKTGHPGLAPIASLVGGLAAPMGAVGAVNGVASAVDGLSGLSQSVPTIADLNVAKKAAYSAVDNSTMKIAQPAVQDLYNTVKSTLEKRGLTDKTIGNLAPKTSTALDALKDASTDDQTLQGMEVQRRIAGIAAQSIDRTDRASARIIQDHIDDFIGHLQPEQLSGPIDQNAVDALPIARDLAQRSFKAQTIQGIIDKAATNSSTFSASGLENALRSGFRRLANNDRGIARFNPDEQDAIRQVATGGSALSASNLLRQVGKLSPQGAIPMMAELGGVAALGPKALAVPAVGLVARMGATALTKGSAQRALNLVSTGPQRTVGDALRTAAGGDAGTPSAALLSSIPPLQSLTNNSTQKVQP